MLGRFREELVGEDELEKAKRRFVSDVESSYDDLDGLCGWFGGTELYCPADPQEKRARALARVRPEDIRDVARRVLRPERLSVTAVGALSPTLSRRVEKLVMGFEYAAPPAATAATSLRLLRALGRFVGDWRGVTSTASASGLLDRLARLLLTEHEARLGVDRLLARLGRGDRDVEARASCVLCARSARVSFAFCNGHARGRRERDGDRRLGVDVPAALGGDRQARRGGRADRDLGLRLLDLVERRRRRGGARGENRRTWSQAKQETANRRMGLRVAGDLSPRHR